MTSRQTTIFLKLRKITKLPLKSRGIARAVDQDHTWTRQRMPGYGIISAFMG